MVLKPPGAFTGSALAMKIAPFKGLLPGDANKDILSAWSKFAALPQIDMVLKPLKMDATKFMLAVATMHLVVAMLLVLPTGKYGSKLAGLWAMVAMLGAEFCTRKTAYVPAGFPKEFKTLGAAIGSATHLFLFLCGSVLVFSQYQGTLVQMLNELLAKIKPAPKTEEQRGRSGQVDAAEDKGNKRDSTPNPSARLVNLWPAVIAAAIFAIVLLLWFWASMQSSKATGPRMHVEAMKLSYGTQVESILRSRERYDSVMQTPLSQSHVVRIQGRVVPGTHGTLTSPLWQRESVMYFTSVTPKTADGNFGSPLTVHSRSVDFGIQLLDAPHIQLAVCGQDAMLFDMKRGDYEKDLTLADAGENWQDFVLNHAGAERTMEAFESHDRTFQFREIALSLGAIVTCVGEVRHDQYGVLGLWPWQDKSSAYTKVDAFATSRDGSDPFSSDLEKVLISDDSSLFPKS